MEGESVWDEELEEAFMEGKTDFIQHLKTARFAK